jgi:hypothetical protein
MMIPVRNVLENMMNHRIIQGSRCFLPEEAGMLSFSVFQK